MLDQLLDIVRGRITRPLEIITPRAEIRKIYENGRPARMRAVWTKEDGAAGSTSAAASGPLARKCWSRRPRRCVQKLPMVDDPRDESDHEKPDAFSD